ncbi:MULTISPECIES: glycosyltransferase [Streptomyces]|uniref:glycosyltransferase n=1 Tax=Streptomyces TaxID=1883 RepID=UPI0023DCFD26|nr:glycosyltransferase [Streptomyces sp. FXJ1.172]WEP00634.1 glycosyltransferase [Streptomyces sp. FXJ1.172]
MTSGTGPAKDMHCFDLVHEAEEYRETLGQGLGTAQWQEAVSVAIDNFTRAHRDVLENELAAAARRLAALGSAVGVSGAPESALTGSAAADLHADQASRPQTAVDRPLPVAVEGERGAVTSWDLLPPETRQTVLELTRRELERVRFPYDDEELEAEVGDRYAELHPAFRAQPLLRVATLLATGISNEGGTFFPGKGGASHLQAWREKLGDPDTQEVRHDSSNSLSAAERPGFTQWSAEQRMHSDLLGALDFVGEWSSVSSVFGARRSPGLRKIDSVVRELSRDRTDASLLVAVLEAVAQWRAEKDPASTRWPAVRGLAAQTRQLLAASGSEQAREFLLGELAGSTVAGAARRPDTTGLAAVYGEDILGLRALPQAPDFMRLTASYLDVRTLPAAQVPALLHWLDLRKLKKPTHAQMQTKTLASSTHQVITGTYLPSPNAEGFPREIPKIQHYLWFGGPLFDDGATRGSFQRNVARNAEVNKGFLTVLWTDVPRDDFLHAARSPAPRHGYTAEVDQMRQWASTSGVVLANIDELLTEQQLAAAPIPARLLAEYAKMERQRHVTPAYASASDACRILILHFLGGLYNDVDNTITQPLDSFTRQVAESRDGFALIRDEDGYTDISAQVSFAGSPASIRYMEAMASHVVEKLSDLYLKVTGSTENLTQNPVLPKLETTLRTGRVHGEFARLLGYETQSSDDGHEISPPSQLLAAGPDLIAAGEAHSWHNAQPRSHDQERWLLELTRSAVHQMQRDVLNREGVVNLPLIAEIINQADPAQRIDIWTVALEVGTQSPEVQRGLTGYSTIHPLTQENSIPTWILDAIRSRFPHATGHTSEFPDSASLYGDEPIAMTEASSAQGASDDTDALVRMARVDSNRADAAPELLVREAPAELDSSEVSDAALQGGASLAEGDDSRPVAFLDVAPRPLSRNDPRAEHTTRSDRREFPATGVPGARPGVEASSAAMDHSGALDLAGLQSLIRDVVGYVGSVAAEDSELPGAPLGLCLSSVERLREALFPEGVRSGSVLDDGLLGVHPARDGLSTGQDWTRVPSWRQLRDAVGEQGPGSAAFVLAQRTAERGHALAAYALRPAPGRTDQQVVFVEMLAPDGDRVSADSPWLPVADARAVVVDPRGRSVAQPFGAFRESASLGHALVDASIVRNDFGALDSDDGEGRRPWHPLRWPHEVTVTIGQGATGVYFVRSAAGSHAVVKPMWDTSSHYADRFIRKVAGVATPRAEVVRWDTPAGRRVEELLPVARNSMVNFMARWGETSEGGPEYFAVMQHARGEELTGLDGEGLRAFLTDHTALESVGRVLAADIFLGNNDRMSDFHINYSNLLYDPEGAELTAIDNSTYFGGLPKEPEMVAVNFFGVEERYDAIPSVAKKFVDGLHERAVNAAASVDIGADVLDLARSSVSRGAFSLFSRIGSDVLEHEQDLRFSYVADVPYDDAWQPDEWMVRGWAQALRERWGKGPVDPASGMGTKSEESTFDAMKRLESYFKEHWTADDDALVARFAPSVRPAVRVWHRPVEEEISGMAAILRNPGSRSLVFGAHSDEEPLWVVKVGGTLRWFSTAGVSVAAPDTWIGRPVSIDIDEHGQLTGPARLKLQETGAALSDVKIGFCDVNLGSDLSHLYA